MLTDLLDLLARVQPGLAVLVSAITVLVALWSILKQSRLSSDLARYEAVRRKRAVAKALREEISAILNAPPDATVKPTIFQAHAADIGRLNEKAIRSIIQFYAVASQDRPLNLESIRAKADAAISDLDEFLTLTEPERNRLSQKIKVE